MLISINVVCIPLWIWIHRHLRRSETLLGAADAALIYEIHKHLGA